MQSKGIHTVYNCKYDPSNPEFLRKIGMPYGPQFTYVCIGVKASNYFMPDETLSDKGPGGGGWIIINKNLQVMKDKGKTDTPWGGDKIFAVGDCNFGCVAGD